MVGVKRALGTIFFLAVLLRLLHAGRWADSFDAVDFALALESYDVFRMQPHFPGYPVYILAAEGIQFWVPDPVRALTVLAALAGGALVFPVYALAARLKDKRAGLIAALLVACNPYLWLTAEMPMSESLGILFLYLFLALLFPAADRSGTVLPERNRKEGRKSTRRSIAKGAWPYVLAGFVFGVAMGVRVSYFPFGVLLFYSLWKRMAAVFFCSCAAFVLGVCLWIFPVAWHEGGLAAYLELGVFFTQGHFSDWGGTAYTSGDLYARLRKILWEHLLLVGFFGKLEENGLLPAVAAGVAGGAVLLTLLLLLALFAPFPRRGEGEEKEGKKNPVLRSRKVFFSLAFIPYFTWALLGQNADKPRHIAVLVPLCLVFLACAFSRVFSRGGLSCKRLGTACLALLFVSYAWSGYSGTKTYAEEKPPVVQAADFIAARYPLARTLVVTWEEERVIRYYYPDVTAVRLRSFAYFYQTLLNYRGMSHVVVTDKVLAGFGKERETLAPFFQPVATFAGSRYLYPVYNRITLYEADPRWLQRLGGFSRDRTRHSTEGEKADERSFGF
ncbi:hypothetical protein BSNK01_10820 [Bacillaceae bacterium]